eukprot:scaffold237152_cov30-Tisochrysis_lutea.AAC.3
MSEHARVFEDSLLSIEWEPPSVEAAKNGRLGSWLIKLDVEPLDVVVRIADLGLRLLGTERHRDVLARGRNGRIAAEVKCAHPQPTDSGA